MKLPIFQNTNRARAARQGVEFRGINWSERVQEGDLRDSKGLTTARYPILSQRTDRPPLLGYIAPSDFYCRDGVMYVVDGTRLCKDGVAIASVREGKKQWAVVNTKLCIFPDKLMVDLKDGTVESMDVAAEAPGSVVVMTENSVQAQTTIKISSRVRIGGFAVNGTSVWQPAIYTYGPDVASVKTMWDPVTRTWSGMASHPRRELTGMFGRLDNYWNDPCVQTLKTAKQHGDIFIPNSANQMVYGNVRNGEYPDESQYNTNGVYGVVVDFDTYVCDGDTMPADGQSGMSWIGAYDQVYHRYQCSPYVDLYKIQDGISSFVECFKVGDAVKITGTPYGICDREQLIIKSIDGATNTITFADGSIPIPSAIGHFDRLPEGQQYQAKLGSTYYKFTIGVEVGAGYLVLNGPKTKLSVWDDDKKEYIAEYTVTGTATSAGSTPTINLSAYNISSSTLISIQRDMPDLDYVCESNNRLWGVSSDKNTIFASALGLPCQMYDYSNSEDGAWGLGVGSEGRFTAICNYANAVCCWKEHQLIRILGTAPSDYYSQSYGVAGVQEGSEKSLVAVNEVLYYQGPDGVYCYTGNTPSKISLALGQARLREGVGGKYRDNYYLSAKDERERELLLVYDPTIGQWMKEDERKVAAMGNIDGELYFLNADQSIQRTDPGEEEMLEWMAELAPFNEAKTMYTRTASVGVKRKGYSCLRIQLDMSDGAWVKVEVKEDRAPWRLVWTQAATRDTAINIPLRIGRCDRFAVRLTGKGRTDIRSIVREFLVGSEV